MFRGVLKIDVSFFDVKNDNIISNRLIAGHQTFFAYTEHYCRRVKKHSSISDDKTSLVMITRAVSVNKTPLKSHR